MADDTPQARLLSALRDNRFSEFENLLASGQVDPRHYYGQPHFGTCLEIACRRPDYGRYVELLLSYNIPTEVNHIRPEPLHLAAKNGSYEVMTALLSSKKIRLNVRNAEGKTPLCVLVFHYDPEKEGYRQCLRMLLRIQDVDVNAATYKNLVPAHIAAKKRKREALEDLLEFRGHQLDLDSLRNCGRTARETITAEYPDLVPKLPPLRAFAGPHWAAGPTRMLLAVQEGNGVELERLLQQVDEDGEQLLDPDHEFDSPIKATALQIASQNVNLGHLAEVLLEAGADPEKAQPGTGLTPLQLATIALNEKAIAALGQVGAVWRRDKDGRTPLHLLVAAVPTYESKAQESLTALLQARNAQEDVDETDAKGESALEMAVRLQLPWVVERLLELGAMTGYDKVIDFYPDIAKSFTPATPEDLHLKRFILSTRSRRQVSLPMPKSTSDEKTDSKGNTDLALVARRRNLTATAALLAAGADPRHLNVYGRPALPAEALRDMLDASVALKGFPDALSFAVCCDLRILVGPPAETKIQPALSVKDVQTSMRSSSRRQPAVLDGDEPMGISSLMPDEDSRSEEVSECGILMEDLTNSQMSVSTITAVSNGTANQSRKQEISNTPVNAIPIKDKIRVESHFLHSLTRGRDYQAVFNHPLISVLLDLKWECIKWIFYLNVAMFVLFVLLLNSFIWVEYRWSDRVKASQIIEISLLLFLVYFFLREIAQLIASGRVYFRCFENYLDLSIIVATLCTLLLDSTLAQVLAMLVTSLELLLVLGRVPMLSQNIEMLKVVSKNYFLFFLSYIPVILVLAHCFYILFFKNELDMAVKNMTAITDSESSHILPTIRRISAMMAGEFEARDLFEHADKPIISDILFIFFVFFITILLGNLLIGMTVNDSHAITCESNILCMKSRIRIIHEIELILVGIQSFSRCAKWTNLNRWINSYICLFDPSAEPKSTMIHIYPNNNGVINSEQAFSNKKLSKFLSEKSTLDEAMNIARKKQQSEEEKMKSNMLDPTVKTLQDDVKRILEQMQNITHNAAWEGK